MKWSNTLSMQMFISIFKIWHGNYRTKECKYTDWIFCWVQVLKSGIPRNPEALGADLAPVDILANILANVATLLLLHWTTCGQHLLQTHLPKHFHVRLPPPTVQHPNYWSWNAAYLSRNIFAHLLGHCRRFLCAHWNFHFSALILCHLQLEMLIS